MERCNLWLDFCNNEELRKKPLNYLTKNAFICSLHFNQNDFLVNTQWKRKLKLGSVPVNNETIQASKAKPFSTPSKRYHKCLSPLPSHFSPPLFKSPSQFFSPLPKLHDPILKTFSNPKLQLTSNSSPVYPVSFRTNVEPCLSAISPSSPQLFREKFPKIYIPRKKTINNTSPVSCPSSNFPISNFVRTSPDLSSFAHISNLSPFDPQPLLRVQKDYSLLNKTLDEKPGLKGLQKRARVQLFPAEKSMDYDASPVNSFSPAADTTAVLTDVTCSFQNVPSEISSTPVVSPFELGCDTKKTSKLFSAETYKKKMIQYRKENHKLKMSLGRLKKSENSKKGVIDAVSKPVMELLLAQSKNALREKHGRRWSPEIKDFAWSLYYHGRRSYKFLRKHVLLPSPATLRRHDSKISVKPGILPHVTEFFIQNNVHWPESDRVCTLIFDEVAIREGFKYNPKEDLISGFVDNGVERKLKPCNQVLVAMVKGIKKTWKQILGYWLTADTESSDCIKKCVMDSINALHECKMIPKLIICDQSSKNRKVLHELGVSVENPYFMFRNERIYVLYDPPHLLKSMRNNLYKYNFEFRGQVVEWKYVQNLYDLEDRLKLKMLHKLTENHVRLKPFSKMKVKLAAQVFSRTVYIAILTFIGIGKLSPQAVNTGKFLNKMDKMFDCFNSTQFKPDKFKLRYAISPASPHLAYLNKMKNYLITSKFLLCKKQPACLEGWVLNITSLELLVVELRDKFNLTRVRTRLLNQDALENTFAIVRQQHGCCDNPTVDQFEKGIKALSLSSIPKLSKNTNCEADLEQCLVELSSIPAFVEDKVEKECENYEEVDVEKEEMLLNSTFLSVAEANSFYYCCGYILKQYLKSHNCEICSSLLLLGREDRVLSESHMLFSYFKSFSKELQQDFGHLHLPKEEVFKILTNLEKVFNAFFFDNAHKKILMLLKSKCEVFTLNLELCQDFYTDKFIEKFLKTRILWGVTFLSKTASAKKGEARKLKRKMQKVKHK